MDMETAAHIGNLKSTDKDLRYQAFLHIQSLTNEKVDWAYEIWNDLVLDLAHPDNHRRAIAAQLLCNLALSDPEGRIMDTFPALLEMTRDERFVTARHSLQSLWKIGLAGQLQKEMLLGGLAVRFREAAGEKHGTLIRADIIRSLRMLYEVNPDETIRILAMNWIEREEEMKYRKKYTSYWK